MRIYSATLKFKRIGYDHYFHKSQIEEATPWIKDSLENIEYSFQLLYKKILNKCDIIKVNQTRGVNEITFIEVRNFDKDLNPVIIAWYKFKLSGVTTVYKGKKLNSKSNPLILHKKELMVQENYKGFSVELSRCWTDFYFEQSGINEFRDTKKIGRKKYWDSCLQMLMDKMPTDYIFFMNLWNKQFKE